jgi:hypothetical protein
MCYCVAVAAALLLFGIGTPLGHRTNGTPIGTPQVVLLMLGDC